MLRTFTPSRRATSEWPNSCSSTETNSSRAVSSPMNQLIQTTPVVSGMVLATCC